MLEIINDERARAGVAPVVLGDNNAAQLHAESSLANCFSGHWGVDGLKPYMRYSLAGGYQSNGENGLGSDYCITASDRYRAIGSIEQEIRDGMDGWMDSPGHRDNILDPWHKKVNIGLAWDRYNFFAYQHFEGDYVEYDQIPAIENGILTMSGTVKNRTSFADERDLGVQIYYDQPPHTLTRGQLARTHCYDSGPPVAALRPPPPPNYSTTISYKKPCSDPYKVSPNAPAPEPPRHTLPTIPAPQRVELELYPNFITVQWIAAREWTTSDDAFAVRVDLNDLLSKHGDGVYSIVVWGKTKASPLSISGTRHVISQYSIFYGVTPPDTYDPSRYD